MTRIICLALGYAIGLIQTAYIVGKLFYRGIDIRDYGSGNAGTTNTLRVLGFKAGAAVFLCDVLKAVLAYTLCSLIFGGGGSFLGDSSIVPGLYGGIGAVLGHSFPFYLKFKGGKGIASTLGIIICIDFRIMLILFSIGIIIVIFTRYISAAALTITLLLPVAIFYFGYGYEAAILGAVVTVMSWYLHRGNIKRIIEGKENKFSFKKQL